VQLHRKYNIRRNFGFFRIALCNDDLTNYYMSNFTLMQFYKYSLTELDNMYPWEREIYISLLNKHIEEENERIKNGQKN
jgi:hypothetical protein